MVTPYLYSLPIGVTLLIFLVALLASLEYGYREGLRRRREWRDAEGGGGGLVQNSLFALLGLVIAFTYSFAVSHFENRKTAVITEANAIGTAFLRAGLFKDRGGTELQAALLEYARTRVITIENAGTRESAAELKRRTLAAQASLWPLTEKIVKSSPQPGPMEATLVAAMNDVIDNHMIRLAAALDYMPEAVFWTLLFIASVAVGIGGYMAGLTGRMCRWRMTSFVLVLASVMYLIADFDRPVRGFIRVSQFPILEAIADMESTLGVSSTPTPPR